MVSYKSRYIFFVLFGSSLTWVHGQTSTVEQNIITTAVPFLAIAPDAKQTAMGDAGVTSKGSNAMHWNASQLVFNEDTTGISLSYTPWLRALIPDINLWYLSAYRKINPKNTIGLSARYFDLGKVDYFTPSGSHIGSLRPYEYSIDAAISRKINHRNSMSLTIRYINSNFGGQFLHFLSQNGKAISADFGYSYVSDKILIGTQISNVGNKISYNQTYPGDFLPMNLRIGTGYYIIKNITKKLQIIADLNKLLVPSPPKYLSDSVGNLVTDLQGNYIIVKGRNPNRSVTNAIFTSFYDAPGGLREELQEVTVATGVEYTYKFIRLRSGFFYENYTKGDRKYLTTGIGINYRFIHFHLSHLIPLKTRSPLANTLRISLEALF